MPVVELPGSLEEPSSSFGGAPVMVMVREPSPGAEVLGRRAVRVDMTVMESDGKR